ncbi:hypothetical protein DPMN_085803 [Dreissena polymorpha]|uniref:Uncharacterized protein n=1 Tax=Dreissena polymorpha TaxID=45954 RepID=A0A9D3YHN7_DREPO|nr:hypothetical protein DPMN_085803 [Dreissena polymorpha]
MQAFQLTSPTQPTFQQYRCRPPLTQVSYGQPAQEDFSQSSIYVQSAPLTIVTNVASPLTRALVSSGIDASTLQDNITQEDVNMDSILPPASDVSTISRANTPLTLCR